MAATNLTIVSALLLLPFGIMAATMVRREQSEPHGKLHRGNHHSHHHDEPTEKHHDEPTEKHHHGHHHSHHKTHKQHPHTMMKLTDDGPPCSLSLARYDSRLPDKFYAGDSHAWNHNFLTTVCAIEELVASKQVSFYYPVEGTIIALMRYGRNVGNLSVGTNIVEKHNDIDIMVEIPEGRNVIETLHAISAKLTLQGYQCEVKAKDGARNCFSTKWFTCKGKYGNEPFHADIEFYTTAHIGSKAYAVTNCYKGLSDAENERMPLSHIRDTRSQKQTFCAFLPSSMLVPCPTDAAEMSRVWQSFDSSRDGKMEHVVLPDEFRYSLPKVDMVTLKQYAKMLRNAGALSYASFFDS